MRITYIKTFSHMQGLNNLLSTYSFKGRCASVRWKHTARKTKNEMLRHRSNSGKKLRQVPRLQMAVAQGAALPERNRVQGTLEEGPQGKRQKEGGSDRLFYILEAF